jgi:ribonuclease-3
LELGHFLRLSRGEEQTGGRGKRAILADLFESTITAIYLDGGMEPTRVFVLRLLVPVLERIDAKKVDFRDYKSTLQETLHRKGRPEPDYRILGESGPDHQKEFQVGAYSLNQLLGEGSGRSKKEAEQNAAEQALQGFEDQ